MHSSFSVMWLFCSTTVFFPVYQNNGNEYKNTTTMRLSQIWHSLTSICKYLENVCGLIVGNYCGLWSSMPEESCYWNMLLIMWYCHTSETCLSISWTFISCNCAKGMRDITLLVSKEYQPHAGCSGDHHQALGRSQELHPKSSFRS